MITKRVLALVLALMMTLTLFGCGEKPAEDGTDDAPKTVTITDMIGRQVEIVPGSYQRVVCIGAGALRLYSYVGDVSLLCGVEDIDNTTLEERPKMFDGVARPYVMVYGDTFAALPSCGVGGPNAQAAEAEKILSCSPDIIVITGDLVDSNHTNVERAVAFVKEAVKIALVYYVTGNHEYWLEPSENEQMMQGILAAGACDLDDEAVCIEKGDSSFMLAGLDDQHLSDETLKNLLQEQKNE